MLFRTLKGRGHEEEEEKEEEERKSLSEWSML